MNTPLSFLTSFHSMGHCRQRHCVDGSAHVFFYFSLSLIQSQHIQSHALLLYTHARTHSLTRKGPVYWGLQNMNRNAHQHFTLERERTRTYSRCNCIAATIAFVHSTAIVTTTTLYGYFPCSLRDDLINNACADHNIIYPTKQIIFSDGTFERNFNDDIIIFLFPFVFWFFQYCTVDLLLSDFFKRCRQMKNGCECLRDMAMVTMMIW